MGIDVAWMSERGEKIQVVLDVNNQLTRAIAGNGSWSNTYCLRFIDEYGDTVFNQLQIPVLLDEIQALKALIEDVQQKTHLKEVLALIEQAGNEIHTYIKFIGD